MDVPVAIDRRPGKEILLHGARERIVGDIGSVSRHRFKIDHAGVALACRQHHCKADPTEPAILVASNLRAVSSTKCRRDFASIEKSLVALRAHEVHTSLAISFVLPSDAIWGARTNRWRRNIPCTPENVT